MLKFGHDVSFEQARGQTGKGGDKLIPVFLSADKQRDHGKEQEEWRGNRFNTEYLPVVRPFSAVLDLLRRVRKAGLRIAVASSAIVLTLLVPRLASLRLMGLLQERRARSPNLVKA
jgi:phosphoglycolate phosphatase-like HAD superfamily hydrolase